MGEYTGAPVTVYQTHSVFVKPEEWGCPARGITVEKLRELFDDPDFSAPSGATITISEPGEAHYAPSHEGMVEMQFTWPVMEC
jgi:hypothetical protein